MINEKRFLLSTDFPSIIQSSLITFAWHCVIKRSERRPSLSPLPPILFILCRALTKKTNQILGTDQKKKENASALSWAGCAAVAASVGPSRHRVARFCYSPGAFSYCYYHYSIRTLYTTETDGVKGAPTAAEAKQHPPPAHTVPGINQYGCARRCHAKPVPQKKNAPLSFSLKSRPLCTVH